MSQPRSPVSIPAPTIASSYPLPPTNLIDFYTDENVTNGIAPDPPEPIVDGVYSVFGVERGNDDDQVRPLEAQGIKRLYPRDFDHKRELKKMNSSILLNFLDLIDINVKCPDTDKRIEKCTDIAMLFIQMHHLINEMRPHQAREAIRVALYHQNKQRIDIFKKLIQQMEQVAEIVSECTKNIPNILEQNIGFDIEEFCTEHTIKREKDNKRDENEDDDFERDSTSEMLGTNDSIITSDDFLSSLTNDDLPGDQKHQLNGDKEPSINDDNEKDLLMCDIVESLVVV